MVNEMTSEAVCLWLLLWIVYAKRLSSPVQQVAVVLYCICDLAFGYGEDDSLASWVNSQFDPAC